jgi:RNA polymerase sigma-70 factor (ECF subfamily)
MMTSEYNFNTIYDEYYQKIVRYLTRIVGPNDAEDAAQDVFDKIHRNLSDFQGKSKLSVWIYRIATNTAVDKLRSSAFKHLKGQQPFEESAEFESKNDPSTSTATTAEQAWIRKEMSECVIEFIDTLPPDYRTVIVLSELEDLTNKEIADILEVSVENVKIRLHRARTQLKTALNDGCDFYHTEENTLACDRKPTHILPKRNT